ncbi:hypothetical protein JOD31_001711 [Methylopila capsulata]|uniref:Uncharacterized protein n=2 Tax=Methylopila capsulata TaxID=61654 RepID=A0ABS2T6L5_9HYPH|nr:hypothetical protein [Methylopila capsulata]MBM7851486.1 hypothetical protein [Methylopila capsulata]
MENGKCRLHGGVTPRGQGWHRMTAPRPGASDADERYRRKDRDVARRAKKRRRALEAMTPEQRQAAEAWQRAHQPGDFQKRAAARQRRKDDADGRALLDEIDRRREPPLSPEAAEIAAAIAALRAERDQLLAQAAASAEDHDFNNYTDGVFG